MYKCCIFDLDGTLVNSIYAIQKSVNDTLSYWNMREISVEESRLYVGDGYKKLLERSLIACGDKELTHYEEAVERYQDIFRECCMYRVEAYEGIGELLEFLKSQGISLQCCPTSPIPEHWIMCRECLERGILTWSTESGRISESRRSLALTAYGP